MYEVTFRNRMTPARFGHKIPEDGLVFSPLAGASHSNRFSLLTVRGLANSGVSTIARTGDTSIFVKLANLYAFHTGLVNTVSTVEGPTLPGMSSTLRLSVDCTRPSITVVSMIAPSPDWIVQISNRLMFDSEAGAFVQGSSGDLIAYDAGVDSGGDFTDPKDSSLDVLTHPQQNIAPLVEDRTDPFMGMVVGKYTIRLVD